MSQSTAVTSTLVVRGRFLPRPAPLLVISLLLAVLAGCGPSINRYTLIEDSLRANEPKRADAIVEQAESDYGSKSRVLYGMDRGMTLQLAGQYKQSNAVLEEAEEEIDRLYTRKLRTETLAFLTNDTGLPYEGDLYEQVMVNVVKALNYAAMGQLDEALVEARRIDHRLNVIADSGNGKDWYRDDGFARYLTGILYEARGELNDAFIAYRKAFEAYESTRGWSRTPTPSSLKSDLLWVTDALHLNTELDEYRRKFPDVAGPPLQDRTHLAQVVVISYNGRAPQKEDQFIDVPISLDALQLVLLNRGFGGNSHNRREQRAADSILYGLNGRVARVAIPRLVPDKSPVAYHQLTLLAKDGTAVTGKTELMQSITALADKSLSEHLPGITTKALARAAVKFAAAEAATRGAQQAAGKDNAAWVGLLVGLVTKGLAVASEESDKRSWRTLPDEIQIARLWVPPGDYQARLAAASRYGRSATSETVRQLSLQTGETHFLIQRVIH